MKPPSSLKVKYNPCEAIIVYTPEMEKLSSEVTEFGDELELLVDKMWKMMNSYRGVGLAAVQVAVFKRVAVIDPGPKHPQHIKLVLVNPEIVEHSEETIPEYEACLSLPGPRVYGKVFRYASVVVKYQDLEGVKCSLEADGQLARIIQHEIDHMNGKLFIHHIGKLARQSCIQKTEKHLRDIQRAASMQEESELNRKILERRRAIRDAKFRKAAEVRNKKSVKSDVVG